MSKDKGFSLMEILLAVAIITIIAGLSTPLYLGLQVRNELDSATNTVAQTLRRTESLAQSSTNDRRWGIRISSGVVTLYRTVSNFNGRESSYDETFSIASNIVIGGTLADNEVNFSIAQGLPLDSSGTALSSDQTITLTSSTNETRTITINKKGVLSF